MACREHFSRLERLYEQTPSQTYFPAELSITEGAAQLVVPVPPHALNAAGSAHGFLVMKAIDDSCYFAASSLVEDVLLLTVNISASFTRSVLDGSINAKAEVHGDPRRIIQATCVLTDGSGTEVGHGSGVFARSRMPLSPEVGYA